MKSLLEMEKAIPVGVAAAGVDEFSRYCTQTWGQSLTGPTYRHGGTADQIVRAIYAAMQYEQQLNEEIRQKKRLERASKARFS